MKVIGMISGTSYDGIDVACCEFTQEDDEIQVKQFGFDSIPYSDQLHQAIAEAMPPQKVDMEKVCILDTHIGQAFAKAAMDTMKKFSFRPDLIVSHGQTLFHWVDKEFKARGTLQLGEPTWIAEETGTAVLSNIRSRDVAANGHGAPLVSLLDALMFGESDELQGALNLGGISNITVAGRGFSPIAYDIGPANGLMDFAIYAHSQGKSSYDEDGRIAASGRVDQELLHQFLNEPFYDLKPPKSTGKELFHLDYLIKHAGAVNTWSIADLMATLLELTVETVAREVERFSLKTLYVAGGGSSNPVMMKRLQERLVTCSIKSMLELGIDPRAKEGVTFALIGFLSAHGLAGQVPSCTGANGERILGSFTPGSTALILPEPLPKRATRLKVLS